MPMMLTSAETRTLDWPAETVHANDNSLRAHEDEAWERCKKLAVDRTIMELSLCTHGVCKRKQWQHVPNQTPPRRAATLLHARITCTLKSRSANMACQPHAPLSIPWDKINHF